MRVGFLFLLSFFLTKSQATHINGSSIHYKQIGELKYEVIVKRYRDCRGIAISTTNNSCSIYADSIGSKTLSLTLRSIEEITYVDASASGGCVPANTYGTGEGIERHIYVDTVDFNDTSFSVYKNACIIYFEISACCRNSAINSGPTGNHYNYSILDLCKAPENSSVEVSKEWPQIQCCNQPVYFSVGAIDSLDRDSISYEWDLPMTSRTTSGSYGWGYAYNQPFKVYYPGSLQFPYHNHNANPPIGLYLDNETGDIIYTPTKCDEVTVAVISIKEWRKDSFGVYQEIGITRLDKDFVTKSCPDNNPPEIDGPFSYNVCEGSQLCFNITSDDKVFIPPPPKSSPPPDTVKLEWFSGIPGSSFNIVNPSARLQTVRFCWTPKIGQASSLPYRFTVQARDNAKPLNSVSSRSFSILVKKKAQTSVVMRDLGCGKYDISSIVDSASIGSAVSYRWLVLDTTGQIVNNSNVAQFKSSLNFLSMSQGDTLILNRSGTYIVQHTINNYPYNCPTVYYDTIVIPSLFEAHLSLGDTMVCRGHNLNLAASGLNGQYPYAFNWLKNGDTISTTSYYLSLANNQAGVIDTFDLVASSSDGCVSTQTVAIGTYPAYFPIWGDSTFSCPDTLRMEVSDAFQSNIWSTGSTDTFIDIVQNGAIGVNLIDSFGCKELVSTYVKFHESPVISLNNQELCEDSLVLDAGDFSSVLWDDFSTDRYRTVYSSGIYELEVEDSNQCTSSTDVTIGLYEAQELDLPTVIDICCDLELELSTLLGADDSVGGLWANHSYPNSVLQNKLLANSMCDSIATFAYLSYEYDNPNTPCMVSDSVWLQVNPLPSLDLSSHHYCQSEKEIDLFQELVNSPKSESGALYTWSCLECNGNDFASLIEDRSATSNPWFWLNIDTTKYIVFNGLTDTIVLNYSFENAFGCNSSDQVEVYISKTPSIPTINRVNYTLYANEPNVNWYRNDTFLMQSDSFKVLVAGSYTAKASNAECESEASNAIALLLNISELQHLDVEAFPNPSRRGELVQLRAPLNWSDWQFSLSDMTGKEVALEMQNDGTQVLLNWQGTSGQYILRMESKNGLMQKQLIRVD
ncbi:MAG: T9SS type A sorting domain-containing protein [Bacteroidia bacterium]